MSDEVAVSPQTQPKLRRRSSLLRQKAVRIGCVPATLLIAGLMVVFFNAVSFNNVPYWVATPRPYVIGGRLVLSGGILLGLQAVGAWLLGLIAARSGAGAVCGQGELLPQRLKILRQRLSFLVWGVVLLRLGVVVVLVLGALYAFTPLLGQPIQWSTTSFIYGIFRSWPLAVVPTIAIVLIQWLAGPFLRMRYSTALGALAATWAKRPVDRPSLALTARLAAGLAGYLAIVWGGGLIWLIVLTIMAPSSFQLSRFANQSTYLLPYDHEVLAGCLIVGGLMLAVLVGQVVLPTIYIRLAQRRLKHISTSTAL